MKTKYNADDLKKSVSQHFIKNLCESLFSKHKIFYLFDYKVKISFLQYKHVLKYHDCFEILAIYGNGEVIIL